MKARVKATGETFVVYGVVNKTCDGYAIGEVELFVDDHDSFLYDMTPAYWEKLRHQYAGMAMGGMCGNTKYNDYAWVDMAKFAIKAAHTLVEKMKEGKV